MKKITSLIPFNNRDLVLKEPVEFLELHELHALLSACDKSLLKKSGTDTQVWMRDRDKLLINVMWSTGARVSDVLGMESTRINFKENSITFLVNKRKSKKAKSGGEFWHTVTLDLFTLTEIMQYIQTWSIKGLLFPAIKGTQKLMTRQAVNKRLNELAELAGIRAVHPHMLRHGIAMHLQAQGVPAEVIAYRLAHSSTSITLQTYARMSVSQEKSIMQALNIQLR